MKKLEKIKKIRKLLFDVRMGDYSQKNFENPHGSDWWTDEWLDEREDLLRNIKNLLEDSSESIFQVLKRDIEMEMLNTSRLSEAEQSFPILLGVVNFLIEVVELDEKNRS